MFAVLPEFGGADELRQSVFQKVPVTVRQQVQQLLHSQERAGQHTDELSLPLLLWDTPRGG